MKAILAIANNYALGKGNGLPWNNQKKDMQYFKNYTLGQKCIVGRKTFEGIGKLPGRSFYVVTNTPEKYESEDGVFYVDMEGIPKDGVVIGGKELYKQLIPKCEEVSITMFSDDIHDCDVFFNPFPYVEHLDIKRFHEFNADKENTFKTEVMVFK